MDFENLTRFAAIELPEYAVEWGMSIRDNVDEYYVRFRGPQRSPWITKYLEDRDQAYVLFHHWADELEKVDHGGMLKGIAA